MTTAITAPTAAPARTWRFGCLTLLALCLTTAPGRGADTNHDGMDDLWQQRYGIAPFTGSANPDGDARINLVEAINFSDPNSSQETTLGMVNIRDVNQDGLDDYWQDRHGISAEQSLDDPDEDGRKNVEESIVGSHPLQTDNPWGAASSSSSQPVVGPSLFTITLSSTIPGKHYQLQVTDDIENWTDAETPAFWGDGNEKTVNSATGGVLRKFYRFKIADLDGDLDGLLDWFELFVFQSSTSLADSDGDLLSDAEEAALGTGLNEKDSDHDGMPDGWEVSHGFLPLNEEDASNDPDGDGYGNIIEYFLRTDPLVFDENSGDPFSSGTIMLPVEADTGAVSFAGEASSLVNNTSPLIPAELLSVRRDVSFSFTNGSNGKWIQYYGEWFNSGAGATWIYNLSARPTLYLLDDLLANAVPFPAALPGTARVTSFDPQETGWFYGSGSPNQGEVTALRQWLRVASTQSQPMTYSAVMQSRHSLSYVADPWNPVNAGIVNEYRYHTLTIPAGEYVSTPVDNDSHLHWHITPGAPYVTNTYSWSIFLIPAQISWEATYGNLADHYDPFTGAANGVAIFPDATTPTGGMQREVRVKVFVPGYANKTVYLKALDVDDPSTVSDPQRVLDPTDGPGYTAGNDNITAPTLSDHGIFLPSFQRQIPITLNSSGYAWVSFRVNQQPGNNYRIAVAVKEADLNFLQVTHSGAAGYVPPSNVQTSGFNGAITPMLTVWRNLHIEVDSMQWYSGVKPSPDRAVAIGDHWTSNTLHLSTPVPEAGSFYNGGRLEIGGGTYPVWGSLNADQLVIGGGSPALGTGQIIVHDDDDTGLPTPRLPNLSVITPGVKAKFRKAFINIVPMAAAYNPNQTIPFNLYSNHSVAWTDLDDSKDSASYDSLAYWCHYLMVSYQPTKDRANDGPIGSDGIYQGVTVWGGWMPTEFSTVYTEVVRDRRALEISPSHPSFVNECLIRQDMVVSHEIGHLPRRVGGHYEPGLMSEDMATSEFAAESLLRFRKTLNWKESW